MRLSDALLEAVEAGESLKEDERLSEAKSKTFQVGDIVKYTSKFLRQTGITKPPKRGEVVGMSDVPAPGGGYMPEIRWSNSDEATAVSPYALQLVKKAGKTEDLDESDELHERSETFQQATSRILDHLEQKGWKVTKHLKIPRADDPHTNTSLWFKSQSVYMAQGGGRVRPSMKDSRSTWLDIRGMDGARFEQGIERLMEEEGEFDDELDEAAAKGEKVTIYSKGPVGIAKTEGYLSGVNEHMVTFIPKRGRREQAVMSYYAPFWMVVKGWGRPEPEDPWNPATPSTTKGVSVQKGRYRSTDPRWVTDFLDGPGSGLKPMAVFQNGALKTYGKVPMIQAEDIDPSADAALLEKSPPGWGGTVKAMKKHMPDDRAFALAWSMYKKGAKPHYKSQSTTEPGKPVKKKQYQDEASDVIGEARAILGAATA